MRCQHAARFCFVAVAWRVMARVNGTWLEFRGCREHADAFAEQSLRDRADIINRYPLLRKVA